MRKLVELLPFQFRILYRQFLLRVFDLEALSIQADIPRFLGQFASILGFISLIGAMGLVMSRDSTPISADAGLGFAWSMDQALISGMMFVAGLVAVVSWDSTFPDRRDIMVLAPLPVTPRNILLAKVMASATLVGLAVLTLNFATGIVWPLILGSQHNSVWGIFRSFAAYWFTMAAASTFLICSVLTVQGFTALLLPRKMFLRLSAILQVCAFGLVLGGYFALPSLTTPAAMALPDNHWVLAWSPPLWFFCLFNQLNGSLPVPLEWLAKRGWISLGIVAFGATTSLLLCYLRTMKKTVEDPDLVPGARRSLWAPPFGSSLRTALVFFCARSLIRSRQHRLAFSFYLAVILSIALFWLHIELSNPGLRFLSADFLAATLVIVSLGVFGLRSVFSLPISLTANWVWRLTQVLPSEQYLAATRSSVLAIAVIPTWLLCALLSLPLRPWRQVAAHLAVLAVLGWVFAELSLLGLHKIPFTCSYLPGKVHVQVLFWCSLVVLVVLSLTSAEIEVPALSSPLRYVLIMCILGIAAVGLYAFNRHRSNSAIIYFEDLQPELITSLRLVCAPRPDETAIPGRMG